MSDLKLKMLALIVTLSVLSSALSVSAISMACRNTYSPYDLNHDGIINIKDAQILALAWQARPGEANFNPACDFNKDGIINIRDVTFLVLNWTWFLRAHVHIEPHTLNLVSHGRWIIGVILITAKVNISDIDISSIKLNNTIPVSSNAPICRFLNGLIVKFSREAVIALIGQSLGSSVSVNCQKSIYVTLTVRGLLPSGLEFVGSDTIRVIHSSTFES